MNVLIAGLIVILIAVTAGNDGAAEAEAEAVQKAVAVAATTRDAASISTLWLASFYPDSGVRSAAVQAVQTRCEHETPAVCTALLGYFVDDPIVEVSWTARDLLLRYDVNRALVRATAAYKLDLLTTLGGRVHLPATDVLKVLRLLVVDPDPAVQENAAWLLENTP